MKFQTKIFQSRLAGRVFGMFALSALLPLGAALFLSFSHVTNQLTDQSQERLRDASKNYGMGLYEKLLRADADLRELASRLRVSRQVNGQIDRLDSAFASLSLITPDGEMHSLSGIVFDEPAVIASVPPKHLENLSAVWHSFARVVQGQVFLSRLLDAEAPDRGVLVGEIDASFLWGDPVAYPKSMHFCVLNDESLPLYCSHGVPTGVFKKASFSEKPSGALTWEYADTEFLAQVWSLFMEAHFAASQWSIVSFQRKGDALKALAGFRFIFVSVILITVLLIALLSAVQLRRGLVPLTRLVEGTRRIAKNDFASRVKVDSGDEFEELAVSVNTMSERLGKQFRALTTLSEVDRSILSNLELEPVIQLVLQRLPEIIDCDCLAVSIFDRDSPDVGSVYYTDRRQKEISVERINSGAEERQRLLQTEKKTIRVSGRTNAGYVKPLENLGAKHITILPVVIDDRLGGLISVGYGSPRFGDADLLMPALDFADRLAVAISTVEREEKLYYQAHYDALTALPNRQLFKDRLEQELLRSRRSVHKTALLFIDLDNFKSVNDSRGHSIGDKLLQQAARRLQDSVREADTVARLGGDEFTVIVPDLTNNQTAATSGRRILQEFSRPFVIDGQPHFVTASIGIAVSPVDGDTCEVLLRNADTAMYRAKDMGRGHFSFYTRSMNTETLRKIEFESELRQALEREEFILYYQPLVDLETGGLIGAEALVRWIHPDRGLVPPLEFINIAEDIGLIRDIGSWALGTACAQVMNWRESGFELQRIMVNVSPKQLFSRGFVNEVSALLQIMGMPADSLELEITENVLATNDKGVIETIYELNAMGLQIALDDFGTGYSSLGYLSRLPVHTLKIDRSFVKHITTDGSSKAIVTAIIQMALVLGKNVVAEGIETIEQAQFLKSKGCREGQGYYFGHPLSATELVTKFTMPDSVDESRRQAGGTTSRQ